jgi:hypothetical protein
MRLSKGQENILSFLSRNRTEYKLDFFLGRKDVMIWYSNKRYLLNSLRNLVDKGFLEETNAIFGIIAKSTAKKKVKHSWWKITEKGIKETKERGL